jgi:hypothetical protein
MELLGHAVDAEVHFDVTIAKAARHFLADDHVVMRRQMIEQLERTVNRIVIGDGDQVHAARLGDAIHVPGLRIAVARAEKRHVAVDLRGPGVNMQVGAQGRCHFSGFSRRICSVVEPRPA